MEPVVEPRAAGTIQYKEWLILNDRVPPSFIAGVTPPCKLRHPHSAYLTAREGAHHARISSQRHLPPLIHQRQLHRLLLRPSDGLASISGIMCIANIARRRCLCVRPQRPCPLCRCKKPTFLSYILKFLSYKLTFLSYKTQL